MVHDTTFLNLEGRLTVEKDLFGTDDSLHKVMRDLHFVLLYFTLFYFISFHFLLQLCVYRYKTL